MKHWYVVYTQPNCEAKAAFSIVRKGFEVYLPRYLAQRRHARRIEQVARPLFPRYLFVRIDPQRDRWRSVNGALGVLHLVSYGNVPVALTNDIVESFKDREDSSGLIACGLPSFTPGQPMEILDGPMSVSAAFFHRMSGKERVVLLLDLLGRKATVTLPRTSVAAA